VLLLCKWPTLPHQQAEGMISETKSAPLRAMILADTHILGSRNGHWLDLKEQISFHRSFLQLAGEVKLAIYKVATQNSNVKTHSKISIGR
jgi:hypothetical protein